jgi:hypothetical protein
MFSGFACVSWPFFFEARFGGFYFCFSWIFVLAAPAFTLALPCQFLLDMQWFYGCAGLYF